MNKPLRDDGPPLTERANAYDEAHLATYLRLLDTDEEGADWRDAVRIIFGIDVEADPERARRIHETHLARARWMTEIGYATFLEHACNSRSGRFHSRPFIFQLSVFRLRKLPQYSPHPKVEFPKGSGMEVLQDWTSPRFEHELGLLDRGGGTFEYLRRNRQYQNDYRQALASTDAGETKRLEAEEKLSHR